MKTRAAIAWLAAREHLAAG
jgi:D-arabinose 1-dehydrogenase-like Zn-dependent alcohol dehydrogenase